MENGGFNFKLPFKYVPECLFKNEGAAFIEADKSTRDDSGKVNSMSFDEHEHCSRQWNIQAKIHKSRGDSLKVESE
jgi:hypothetical protein